MVEFIIHNLLYARKPIDQNSCLQCNLSGFNLCLTEVYIVAQDNDTPGKWSNDPGALLQNWFCALPRNCANFIVRSKYIEKLYCVIKKYLRFHFKYAR